MQSGLFLTASQYLGAQQSRNIIAAYRTLWRSFDVLVTLTSPIAAPVMGATTAQLAGNDVPLVRAFLDLTLPFNLTGQLAISVPCGFTSGAACRSAFSLLGGRSTRPRCSGPPPQYEAATDWHSRRPPVAARG